MLCCNSTVIKETELATDLARLPIDAFNNRLKLAHEAGLKVGYMVTDMTEDLVFFCVY